MKDIWKKYLYNLFNKGYDISPNSNLLNIRENNGNYNYYHRTKKHEVEYVLKLLVIVRMLGQTIYLLKYGKFYEIKVRELSMSMNMDLPRTCGMP